MTLAAALRDGHAAAGTIAGDEVLWLVRGGDLVSGDASLNAESVELTDETLVSLGARRDLDLAEMLRLVDLLTTRDPTGRLREIVGEAVDQVTSLRGRLGAFQKTTLETNIAALNDTLVNLTDAESQIRDADFAVETANLTRAQILVQSGTSVLAIANSNPQNVLALLR